MSNQNLHLKKKQKEIKVTERNLEVGGGGEGRSKISKEAELLLPSRILYSFYCFGSPITYERIVCENYSFRLLAVEFHKNYFPRFFLKKIYFLGRARLRVESA